MHKCCRCTNEIITAAHTWVTPDSTYNAAQTITHDMEGCCSFSIIPLGFVDEILFIRPLPLVLLVLQLDDDDIDFDLLLLAGVEEEFPRLRRRRVLVFSIGFSSRAACNFGCLRSYYYYERKIHKLCS